MEKLEDHVYVVPNLLSHEECDEMVLISEKIGYKEAKVNMHGKQVLMTMVRNNLRVMYKDEVYANILWEKVKTYVPQQIGYSYAFGLNEMLRFYKYEEGHRFKMHRDGSYRRNDTEASQYSFLIYLNDDFEGGETVFRSGTTIRPKKGSALLFLHGLRHEGAVLKNGTKYVLRTDIMYRLNS
ncbi:2OG-Fe(II) oxygenase [uncultured Kordia sp.]|uniref:2OG-Fe(II) oxygenase n=1 Tax=uncultured Kordia sp. TaxID=507699 RepID=UPI002630B811|nr:2OG-Fe(II) oxygenase [uncultured Kordia sp.]